MSTSLAKSKWENGQSGTYKIIATDFVEKDQTIELGTDLKFSIEQLRTPLTTKTSDSFKLYVKDKNGYIVNYIDTDMRATMLKGKYIEAAKVSSSSPRVGDIADHTVSFDSVVPLEASDQLLIIYPS